LDAQYLFAITTWNNSRPSGNTLLVLPNASYIYGFLGNQKWEGIAVLTKYSGEQYILDFVGGKSTRCVYCDRSAIATLLEEKG
jgi:hypothetical protein